MKHVEVEKPKGKYFYLDCLVLDLTDWKYETVGRTKLHNEEMVRFSRRFILSLRRHEISQNEKPRLPSLPPESPCIWGSRPSLLQSISYNNVRDSFNIQTHDEIRQSISHRWKIFTYVPDTECLVSISKLGTEISCNKNIWESTQIIPSAWTYKL
jgi:hypothetical protein